MMNEDILRHIAYLDDDPGPSRGHLAPAELMELVRDAIQLEMAKQGHLQRAEDLTARVAFLDQRVEAMRREFVKQRGGPPVIYVRRSPNVMISVSEVTTTAQVKLPKAMVAFYGLGLLCSLAFATLLSLSAIRIDTIHPFLSLLGLIGGLGWLTTAWTDMLLWKRENPSVANAPQASTQTDTEEASRLSVAR